MFGLLAEARRLLDHADQVRDRMAAGSALVVGTLADSAERLGPRLVAAFRARHPEAGVRMRETTSATPAAGSEVDSPTWR